MVLTPNLDRSDASDDSVILKYRHELPTAILISSFFFTLVPATKCLKKTGWASQIVTLRTLIE